MPFGLVEHGDCARLSPVNPVFPRRETISLRISDFGGWLVLGDEFEGDSGGNNLRPARLTTNIWRDGICTMISLQMYYVETGSSSSFWVVLISAKNPPRAGRPGEGFWSLTNASDTCFEMSHFELVALRLGHTSQAEYCSSNRSFWSIAEVDMVLEFQAK